MIALTGSHRGGGLFPDGVAAITTPGRVLELPVGTFSLTNSLQWFVSDPKLNGLC